MDLQNIFIHFIYFIFYLFLREKLLYWFIAMSVIPQHRRLKCVHNELE